MVMMNRKMLEEDLARKHSLFADLVVEKYSTEVADERTDILSMVTLSKEIILDKTFLAGGCIASQLRGEPVKDYDIFLKDQSRESNAVEKYFGMVQQVKKSANAATYKNTQGLMLQLITSRHGTPENVIAGFDFRHCQNYFNNGQVTFTLGALEATMFQELQYTGQPGSNTLLRVVRFLNRGWTIDPTVYLKMVKSLDVPEHARGESDYK